MNKLVVASMRQGAGKTSVIIGMAKALGKKIGYMKPFGERLLYRKKRLWDYDAALITSLFKLEENPEDMSIGFHHAKLLYMLDEQATREKLGELLTNIGENKDLVFIEGGRDLSYGVSVHLDPLSVAEALDADWLVVVSGDGDLVLDDVTFLKKRLGLTAGRFRGVLINNVPNIDDFRDTHLPKLAQLEIPILGVIPYEKRLTYRTVGYLADRLFAKVLSAEANLNRVARDIFIGSTSCEVAVRNPLFHEPGTLVLTTGDRSDMLLAALDAHAAAVLLTNNILPAPHLISRAEELGIPLLFVTSDTYDAARQIDGIETLATRDDQEKIALIEEVFRKHVDLAALDFA
ncbi:MAG: AAA family ATPase [Syntrophales bacterium]|mgnify:CR=1 FL=1|nr:AAA family ATPase [Syntrophales bacterium]MDD4338285.1 AAA family ATPase [Syntrophales bacterium]HOG08235.1 AAA family ATPase [Syntrophales bacterium]HOS78049.1 AAA family ATPase [Syntrophales bacterium]HPB70269.1 AAA family ATPase [Syntrophales bacterium]